jgi:hypothetical protein
MRIRCSQLLVAAGRAGRLALAAVPGVGRWRFTGAAVAPLAAVALLAAALPAEAAKAKSDPTAAAAAKDPALPKAASSDIPPPPPPLPRKAPTPAQIEAAQKVRYPKPQAEMETLAKSDPLEFLRLALKWHDDRITDYSCQFVKMENIAGALRKSETMVMKFRAQPFSVYVKWIEEVTKGQEVIYIDGINDGKACVHPSGLLGILFRKVSIDPLSKIALKHSRRPLTMAGMGNMLRLTVPQCEAAKANGDLSLTYEGIRQEDGRPTYLFKRVLPNRNKYPCEVLLIYIDCEYLLCVRTDAWDWGGALLSHYSYTDLTINPGLEDIDFDPDNRDYNYRLF